MSTPLLWIGIPGLTALLLYALRRWKRVIHWVGILVVLMLAAMAWLLPIGEPISLGLSGLPALKFTETALILGRRFVLDDTARPTMLMLYLGIALWFGGASVAQTDRLFVPLVLGIAALLTAAIAVRPTLYAAIIIEMVALLCVPILSPPGKTVNRGVLRFLTFQTIGTTMILLADLLLSAVGITPADPTPALHAIALMSLGFALITAIFPFHTWVPMLAEETHPYAAAFVFFILPATISIIGLDYLNRYSRLPEIGQLVFTALRYAGALMVITGGVWAAVQRHLGRILGFAALVQIGMGLLALSLGQEAQTGAPVGGIFFVQLLPLGVCLALWALSLHILQNQAGSMYYGSIRGIVRHLPITVTTLVLVNFSLAGLPLLASFPVNVALWSELAKQSLPTAFAALVGSIGLFIAGLRTLAVCVMNDPDEAWRVTESRSQFFLLIPGWIILFLIGLMPQWFLPLLTDMARTFIQTQP